MKFLQWVVREYRLWSLYRDHRVRYRLAALEAGKDYGMALDVLRGDNLPGGSKIPLIVLMKSAHRTLPPGSRYEMRKGSGNDYGRSQTLAWYVPIGSAFTGVNAVRTT